MWFNGGPGASSLMGIFSENIGPQQIQTDGSLKDNPHNWLSVGHVIMFDNPVGSG